MSSSKIVCRHETVEITLDCSQLELNLYRILKLLNEVHLLPVVFPERHPTEKIEKSEKGEKGQKTANQTSEATKQIQAKRSYEYELSTGEAMNMIWYSAYMCKSGGLVPYQVNKLSRNKLVGEHNQITEIIQSIEAKIARLKKSQSDKALSLLEQANKKLTRMQQIKNMVSERWSHLKQKYPPEQQPSIDKKITVGTFGLQIRVQDKQKISNFIRKNLVKWDTNILQESIMFIQEIEDGHCIVSVEQCYPSFMVYKELLKTLIGKQHYYKGIKQLLVCKEQSYKEGRPFLPQKYVMCHICKKIERLQQIKSKQTEKICINNPKLQNVESTSHAFQELWLKMNYHRLPLKSLPETEIQECYEQSREFQGYVHPYYKIYYKQCSRYYCELCLLALAEIKKQRKAKQAKQAKKKGKQQKEDNVVKLEQNADSRSQQGKETISQNQPCVFCAKNCHCDRCTIALNFKKLLAVFNSLGGSFQELLPELMFINFYCTRVHLQLVTFNKEEGREEQNSQENRVQLEKNDEETLSYPEQVVKLEGWFSKLRDKQRVKLYGEESLYSEKVDEYESVDENQIFPQLQEMYNKLLKEQEQGQPYSQVKISQEEEECMNTNKRGRKMSEQYESDDQT